jgi:hypothetical protein
MDCKRELSKDKGEILAIDKKEQGTELQDIIYRDI